MRTAAFPNTKQHGDGRVERIDPRPAVGLVEVGEDAELERFEDQGLVGRPIGAGHECRHRLGSGPWGAHSGQCRTSPCDVATHTTACDAG